MPRSVRSPPANPPATRRDDGERWTPTLRRLDRGRARAWRTGNPDALRRMFAPGSPALRADRRQLRRYRARGLVVEGVTMRFSRVRVVKRDPRRVVLAVTDRLAPTRAVSRSGARRLLPRDRWSDHLLTLVTTRHGWRVHSIRRA